MENEYRQMPELDLDKTDRLPVLEGTIVDQDVADDAVPLDETAVLPGDSFSSAHPAPPGFVRPAGVDLPSLAESVRTVEERIARQNAEFDALTRAHDQLRDAESAAANRAKALAVELASARAALEAELTRTRDLERGLSERASALEAARGRVEEALREAERHRSEARTLRDSLAARDATIVQVLHSLGERDAQLSALQQEHARVVPALEATTKTTSQLDAELAAARADAAGLAAELQASRVKTAALSADLKRAETDMNAVQSELTAAKTQAGSYLELLRTREWRHGFDQNIFRELDAKAGAAGAGHAALESERNRLQQQLKEIEARSSAQAADAAAERTRLTAELAGRDRALADAGERGSGEARKVAQLLEAAELKQAEQAAQITQLRAEQAAQAERWQAEAETRDAEAAVLMAHLQEARRPTQSIEAEVQRLTEELKSKSAATAELEEEARKLKTALERTRGALEEREFLIRRLEHSESNNANVLGRIQTSIERLGSVPVTAGVTVGPTADWSGELIKIDGAGPATFPLARRTRIGRALGCELQIESGSVSRHHALVVAGSRETIIEDLNSTNGVLVNGRKVSRQVLADGDAVTIGESQFRYSARPASRPPQGNTNEPAP